MTDTRYRVLVTDHAWPSLDVERAVLARARADLVVAKTGEEEELLMLAGDVDAILCCWKPVSAVVLEAASRCVIVSRYGIGLDNIDVEAATRLGIAVTNVPDYCVEEVADHTLALILACARRVVEMDRQTSRGVWDLSETGSLPRLSEQTLGLVGYGNIGRTVSTKARGVGLRVVACTPRLQPADVEEGLRLTNDLDELLAGSDHVSIHAPLTDSTRGLIGRAALSRMKPTAYLINTSRGAIVDESALLDALRSGEIAGAALDVLTHEPPAPTHPLLADPRVIATPHAAFCSSTAIEELQRRAAEHVVAALAGEVPPHVVNPSVFEAGGR